MYSIYTKIFKKTSHKFCYTKIKVKQQEWVHVYSENRMISNKHIWFAFHKTTSFGILNFHRPWKYWLSAAYKL